MTLESLPIGIDGHIIVGGPQVMKGYLDDEEKSKEVIVELEGIRYYLTGDKGHLDKDGFLFITDRYSRFAKIGGEMISLGSVEEQLNDLLGEEVELSAVALNDDRKGEQIVLLYSSEVAQSEITSKIKKSDIHPLMKPSKIFEVDEIPKLGTGKADFKGAKRVAESLMEG